MDIGILDNDVLRKFLETNSSEIYNMLLEEWNLEDALFYSREEGIEIGVEKTRKEAHEKELQTARNLLAKGLLPELVHETTGLDMEIIQGLKSEQ